MLKTLLICTALVATPALAQMSDSGGMTHGGAMAGMAAADGGAGMQQGQMQGMASGGMGASGQMQGMSGEGMGMSGMMDGAGGDGMMGGMMGGQDQAQGVGGSPLSEPGQSAFAAIAEVVRQLEADPNTDWNNVTIDVLREHLRDMDVVTIDSTAVAEDVDGGVRFTITGAPDVAPSITRMALGHAGVMDGVDDWRYSAEALDNGAVLTVLVPEADLAKLKALGFYGMLASGMHHQPHHWMMANGGGMGG